MRVYQVGGAVRDALLGLAVSDRDWVVVGATPEEMTRLGYQPVGRDFPVFLHPQTKEEYALARTERKTARGYKGFAIHASPEVTLEEDLARRDLTINAMARDESGTLIDPYGGARDLREGVLRHVSPAFAEDPVRILRVARFAARFGFAVAPETAALMRGMVDSGETDALVPERVWQEWSRGLMEHDPWRMLAELAGCGLLARNFPALRIAAAAGQPADENSDWVCRALRFAAGEGFSLPVRFAVMTRALRDQETSLEAFCEALRVPLECRECAVLAGRAVALARDAARLVPMQMLSLVEMADAFRRPRRLDELMDVAEAETYATRHWREIPYRARHAAREGLRAARNVDAASLAAQGGDIGARIRAARYANVLKAMGPGAAADRGSPS